MKKRKRIIAGEHFSWIAYIRDQLERCQICRKPMSKCGGYGINLIIPLPPDYKTRWHFRCCDNCWNKLKLINEKARADEVTCIAEVVNTSTTHAVEIVRCKDCQWCEDCGKGNYLCHNQMVGIDPNFYCAGGVRRIRDDGISCGCGD